MSGNLATRVGIISEWLVERSIATLTRVSEIEQVCTHPPTHHEFAVLAVELHEIDERRQCR